jgi:hypothetical protein
MFGLRKKLSTFSQFPPKDQIPSENPLEQNSTQTMFQVGSP